MLNLSKILLYLDKCTLNHFQEHFSKFIQYLLSFKYYFIFPFVYSYLHIFAEPIYLIFKQVSTHEVIK